MANTIIIDILNEQLGKAIAGGTTLTAPLVDNIQVTGKSNFSTLGKFIPAPLEKYKEIVQQSMSAVGAEVGMGLVNYGNKIDVPIWNGTDPFQIAVKLAFYTITDPKKDVILPCRILQAHAILSPNAQGTGSVLPGISVHTFKALGTTDHPDSREILKNSKLVAFEIPKIIYIPTAFIETANPVFSKERTKGGYPLWATIDLSLKSTQPATIEYYTNVDKRLKEGGEDIFAPIEDKEGSKEGWSII